jgi:hypothetical protein
MRTFYVSLPVKRYLWLTLLLLLAPFVVDGESVHATEDFNKRLRGEWAFTQIHFCVQTRVPGETFVGAALQVPSGGANSSIRSNEGTLAFNGDGTGSFDGKTLTINPLATTPGATPISEGPFTCPLTYAVNDDGSFTTQLTCIAPDGTTISGLELRGQLSHDGELLIANDTNRNVETITLPGAAVLQRVCGRSQTAVRLR